MKRSLGLLAAFLFVSISGFAAQPVCQLTDAQLEKVKAATVDPATTFRHEHRFAFRIPASVKCESDAWRAMHEISVISSAGRATPAPQITPEAKRTTGVASESLIVRAQDKGGIPHNKPTEIGMKKAGSSKADLRTLPQTAPEKFERPEFEEPPLNPQLAQQPQTAEGTSRLAPQSFVPRLAPTAQAPAPLANFAGLAFNPWGAGHPPDTNGDVGPNHYIQTINTSIGIFDKGTGNLITASTFNTFMSQGHFGNLCDTNNFGDPVVVYDTFEDRWIITDFAFVLAAGSPAPPAYQCFAASMSGDPVSGGWNFYSIPITDYFGDYPKFGIWPDGLYMSGNMFAFGPGGSYHGPRAFAFNKAQMYAGADVVQVLTFDGPSFDFTVIPSNARLQAGAPPPGTPNYFVSTWVFLNALTVYKFHVDWDNVSTSTFTGPELANTATAWPSQAVGNAPSQGGNALDTLQIRAMMQSQYSNLGGAESLWVSHTVRRVLNGFAAPRWYQIDVSGSTVNPNAPQAATWAPDGADVIYRFMPSVAVDRSGDLALGYSTSSSTTKPAIKYAGRLAGDAANTLTQSEQLLVQGTGTQSGNCGGVCTRWGDYSAMSLDPDGCTFWYTNMYYLVDGLNHQTRIGSFRYPSCTPFGGGGFVSGSVTAAAGGGPIAGATVALGSRVATTNSSGTYNFAFIPAGTYRSLSVSFPGYVPASQANVAVSDGSTTTANFALSVAPANACAFDTTQSDFQRGKLTNVDVAASPGNVVLSNNPDQQNLEISNSGGGFNATSWLGQTFTAATTGRLLRADIPLFCSQCTGTTSNLTVSVRATSGGLPTGGDLATGTIPAFSSGSSVFHTVALAPQVTLNAGTTYALIVRPNTNPSAGIYAWTRSGAAQNFDAYPGGTRVGSGNSGATWAIVLTNIGTTQNPILVQTDAGFRIFMDTGYAPSGTFISSVKDANPISGGVPTWPSLAWNASTPAGTGLQFQAGASNSQFGPFNFVGPDGTASTFFTTSGASLAQFNGFRYLKYAAYLATSNRTITPAVNDVTICDVVTQPTALTAAPATGTYGGSAVLSATLTTAGGPLGGKNITFTVDSESTSAGSAMTNSSGVATFPLPLGTRSAGAHTYTASFATDSSAFGSSGSNSLTIGKADATITVTPYHVPYDANAHTATATATGVLGESLSGFDLTGTTHTNAGTYNGDPWKFTNANYNDASGTVNDLIDRADAHVVVNAYNVTFDGNAHTATGTATGVKGELLTGLDLSGTTHTDAGTYADTWTFTDVTGNYNNAAGTVTDKIGQASAANITVNGFSGVYDGLPHGATGSVTGVKGENLTSLLSFDRTYTNVPGGPVVWTFAGNIDYVSASGTVNIDIQKAPLTVTANNAARLYGYPNPTFSASYSDFVNGEALATSGVTGLPSFSTTATQFSAAGTYPITPSTGTLAANNYSFVFADGTLTIFESGLIGLDSAAIGGSRAAVNSFDSTTSAQGNSALVLSNGAITVSGAKIGGNLISTKGNVVLQPGTVVDGNVGAGTTITNQGTVTGSVTPNQTADPLVAPPVGDCGAFTANPAFSGGTFTYSNGDVTISGRSPVTLAAGTYCFHNLTVGGQASLQVSGPVNITLKGVLSASGGSFVNTTHVPANLQIASSYAAPNGATISGGPGVYLVIYAPQTNVAISGNASFFGAALGKTLTISGNPDVHYDTALTNVWSVFFGF